MSRATEFRAGHRQGTELVTIELSRSDQVKEIAPIEYISAEWVLLDTLVKPQALPKLAQSKSVC